MEQKQTGSFRRALRRPWAYLPLVAIGAAMLFIAGNLLFYWNDESTNQMLLYGLSVFLLIGLALLAGMHLVLILAVVRRRAIYFWGALVFIGILYAASGSFF